MSTIPSRSNHKIKVFIADDSRIVQERLVTMLNELAGIESVGQAEQVVSEKPFAKAPAIHSGYNNVLVRLSTQNGMPVFLSPA